MMRTRCQTIEHPFGTIKYWMGTTHFQMTTLKHVKTEMCLHVLAYNMKRVMNILGVAHGAQICETEGARVDHLASVLYHGHKCKEMVEIIHKYSYELGSMYDGASLNVYNDIVKCILSHANETESNSELPTFLSQIYQRGVDAGFGDEDRAALVKVLTD